MAKTSAPQASRGTWSHLGVKCPFRPEAGPAFWIIYLIHTASGAAAGVGSWHRGPPYPLIPWAHGE